MNAQQITIKHFENVLGNLKSQDQPDTKELCKDLNLILLCNRRNPKAYENVALKWLKYSAELYISYKTATDTQIEIKCSYFYNLSKLFQEFIFFENLEVNLLQNILLTWIEILSKTDKETKYIYYLNNKNVFIKMVDLLKSIGYYPCQTIILELLLRFIVLDENRSNIINEIFIGTEMGTVIQYLMDMNIKNLAKDARTILNEINEKFDKNIISVPLQTILCDSITFIEPIFPHKTKPNESLKLWLDLNCVRRSITFTVDATSFDHNIKHIWIDCEILHGDIKNVYSESYTTDSTAIIIDLNSQLIIHDKRFCDRLINNRITFIISNQLDKAKGSDSIINNIINLSSNAQSSNVIVKQIKTTNPLTPPPPSVPKVLENIEKRKLYSHPTFINYVSNNVMENAQPTHNYQLRKRKIIPTCIEHFTTTTYTNTIIERQSINLSQQSQNINLLYKNIEIINKKFNRRNLIKELRQKQQHIMNSPHTSVPQFPYFRSAEICCPNLESQNYVNPKVYNYGKDINKNKKSKKPIKKQRITKKLPMKYDMNGYVYEFFVSKNNRGKKLPLEELNSKLKRRNNVSITLKDTKNYKINKNQINHYLNCDDIITISDSLSEKNSEKECTVNKDKEILEVLSINNDKLKDNNMQESNRQIIKCTNEFPVPSAVTYNIDAVTIMNSGKNNELLVNQNDIINENIDCDKNWVLNNFFQNSQNFNRLTFIDNTTCNKNENKSIIVETIEPIEPIKLMEISHNVQPPFVPIEFDSNNKMTNDLMECFKEFIVPISNSKVIPILERLENAKLYFKNHLNDLIEIYDLQIDNLNIQMQDEIFLFKHFNRNLTSEEKLCQMKYYEKKCLNVLKEAVDNVKEIIEDIMNQFKLNCDGIITTELMEKIHLIQISIWNDYIQNIPNLN